MSRYKTSKFDKQWALDQLLCIIKGHNYKNISKKEFTKRGYIPSYGWYANHFGSFANALSELGYYVCYDELIHKDVAIKILEDEYFKNNNKISFNDMKKCIRIATPYIYYKIFNTKSWNEVLSQCGLEQNCITFTEEQENFIINNYLNMRDDEIAKHLGLKESQIQEKRRRMNLYIPKNLIKTKESKWVDYDDEYFVNKLHEFVEIHNRTPDKDDHELLSHINAPGVAVYQSRFGKGFHTILGDIGYGYHRTPFSKEDEQFIVDNYKNMSDLEISNHLRRTEHAIKTRRVLLGCFLSENKRYSFTDLEVVEIKELFDKGVTVKEIANQFNTTEGALIYRYEKFGLKNRTDPWTKSEVKILKKIYHDNDWEEVFKKIPNRNKDSIIHKAYELGIKREIYFWSSEEIELAKQMYLNQYSYKEISLALNSKFTESSISTKLYKEGIVISNRWTDEELDILIEHYEDNLEYVYRSINRDIINIQQRAQKLGLVHPSIWTKNEDEYIRDNYKIKTDYEMADFLDRTRRSVKWRRNKLGLESYFYNHFGNNYPANDGTMCLSNDELYIHNYLLTTDLCIEKEVYYSDVILSDKTKRRFDWVIIDNDNNTWLVEYFGMYDLNRKENSARRRYKKVTRRKIRDLYKAGMIDKCIFIFPNDLKNKTLDEIFGEYIDLNLKQVKIS